MLIEQTKMYEAIANDLERSSHDPVQDLLERGLILPANRFLGHCGKRFRATLVDLSYKIGGGRNAVQAPLINAIEMLHAGSLIIDDIEDGSEWRRGEPTLHRQVGLPLALNTGNWMYFRALELLGDLSVDEAIGHRILVLSIATIRECHEGQALDLAAKIYDIDQQDVSAVAEGIGKRKTGALTSLAARIGAMTAGASPHQEQGLASFGCELGKCLQMRNDLDELRMLAGEGLRQDDMKNARVTWPWSWYAENCPNEAFRGLQSLAYVASTDPAVAKTVATTIDLQIGAYGDQIIENRLQIAFAELCEIVGMSKPLRDLQLLLHAINTSATAPSARSLFQVSSSLVEDRATS